MAVSLQRVYAKLLDHFGPQHWWPGETPFEVIVGAVLTQNTNWKNVEKAIENLRQEGLLDPHALHNLPAEELAEVIRPAGYYRLKAGRLHNVVAYLVGRYDGDLDRMFQQPIDRLRAELLAVKGVGPETADSILLYAGNLPTFVVDAYTYRLVVRHGWLEPEADYHQIKDFFEGRLDQDAALFNEYHALIVSLGKQFCGTRPKCEGCPLQGMLPAGGPCELSG